MLSKSVSLHQNIGINFANLIGAYLSTYFLFNIHCNSEAPNGCTVVPTTVDIYKLLGRYYLKYFPLRALSCNAGYLRTAVSHFDVRIANYSGGLKWCLVYLTVNRYIGTMVWYLEHLELESYNYTTSNILKALELLSTYQRFNCSRNNWRVLMINSYEHRICLL